MIPLQRRRPLKLHLQLLLLLLLRLQKTHPQPLLQRPQLN
jgi:hypothetical protein